MATTIRQRNTFIMVVGLGLALILSACSTETSDTDYTFLVAGHTYGSHSGDNLGLDPDFLALFPEAIQPSDQFLVLTGDIVRKPSKSAWAQVESELSTLGIPSYYVMGNHGKSKHGRQVFQERHGGLYYSFVHDQDLFVVLNDQLDRGRISGDQLTFLRQTLRDHPDSPHVFLFIHELIWTSRTPRYSDVRSNWGSYDKLFETNFWTELMPLFEESPDQTFVVIAGDVAGTRRAWPAFYEELGNVTLVASGLGEVQDENYLRISVSKLGVRFSLVPLNIDNGLLPLEQYGPDWSPEKKSTP